MRWFADECISLGLVEALRGAGHDVVYVSETQPSTRDSDILNAALASRRLLITEDRDFGELVFSKTALPSFGVVYIRIPDERGHMAWPRLQEAIARFGNRLFASFTVVEQARFRIRRLER